MPQAAREMGDSCCMCGRKGGCGSWMKQVGGYLQDAWKTLGALPILIWHVATMPLVDERGSTWWRDTVYFILVGFLVFISRALYLVAEALVGKDENNNGSLASRAFKFAASMGSSNVARTYHAVVNVVCEALLFVVLCHDGSSLVGTGLVSRHFSPVCIARDLLCSIRREQDCQPGGHRVCCLFIVCGAGVRAGAGGDIQGHGLPARGMAES